VQGNLVSLVDTGRVAWTRGVAIAAVVLLLAGCSVEPALVPPGPTDAEVTAIVDGQNARWWTSMFPGVEQPHIEVVEEFNPDEWDAWQQNQYDCLTTAGLDVTLSGGGISYAVTPDQSDGEVNYAQYVCTLEYPFSQIRQAYFSRAQLAYMYDFFANRLGPCMRLLGYDLPEAPSKSVFVDSFYTGGNAWIPYYRVQPMIQEEFKWDEIDWRCGVLPDPFPAFH
jgi:hypothetical protein